MTLKTNQNQLLIPWELYSELIKGKQTFLLLFTGIFAYLISGYPDKLDFGILLLLLASLFLAVSGSTMLNMYWDRDIDAIMERTKDRALPSGKVSPAFVLWHGIIFSTIGVGIAYFINIVTMIVIFAGLFFDVVIYTMLLKRRTKWSIIFGGISGGLPAMAGRTTITAVVDEIAILFLLIILLWIPLHILSLALLPANIEGYGKAKVPMWPIASSVEQTRFVITVAALLNGVLLVYIAYPLKIHIITRIPLYLMGFAMTYHSIRNFINPSHEKTFKLFKFASIFMGITYLWLFIAVVMTNKFF